MFTYLTLIVVIAKDLSVQREQLFCLNSIPFLKRKNISNTFFFTNIGSVGYEYQLFKANVSQSAIDYIKNSRFKDVNVYDDSCELKLTLWGDHVSQIASNGVYMIKDLRVKSFRGKFLTTTASTHIAKTNDKPLESRSVKDQDDQDFEFPADAILFFQKCYFCQKCGRTANVSTVFVVCSVCGSKSLVKK